jgi:hypothetical protein
VCLHWLRWTTKPSVKVADIWVKVQIRDCLSMKQMKCMSTIMTLRHAWIHYLFNYRVVYVTIMPFPVLLPTLFCQVQVHSTFFFFYARGYWVTLLRRNLWLCILAVDFLSCAFSLIIWLWYPSVCFCPHT